MYLHVSPVWLYGDFLKTIYLFISLHQVFVAAWGIFGCEMWDPVPWPGIEFMPSLPPLCSPPTYIGSTESYPLDQQDSPSDLFNKNYIAINIYIQISFLWVYT